MPEFLTRSCVQFAGAVLALFLCSSMPVYAQNVPRYNVPAHCKQIASFGGNYSEMLYGTCMDQEQGSYDALKPTWPHLPSTMRDHCNEIASFGGPGSYMLLKTCVDQELESARANANKGFHY